MATDKQVSKLEYLLGRSGIAPREERTLPNGHKGKTIQPTVEKVKKLTVEEASEIISLFSEWERTENIRDLDLPCFALRAKGIIV